MGRSQRPKPDRLHQKLLQIRLHLGLNQPEMLKRLNHQKSPVYVGHISEFERGKRMPSLFILLQYARVAGVPMETLIDDGLNLPPSFATLKDSAGSVGAIRTRIRRRKYPAGEAPS